MIADLPTEILQQIIGLLPTASDIINLSLTSRKVHADIEADDHAAFRTFVRHRFPSIRTPPLWKDVTRVLTSRSRAWDRKALVARCVQPPPLHTNQKDYGGRPFYSRFGFAPAIDSYEVWNGGRWTNQHHVLAWGLDGKLRMRLTENGKTSWHTWEMYEDMLPEHDILELSLLSPHQKSVCSKETVILRRAGGEVVQVELQPEHNTSTQRVNYVNDSKHVDCMDVNHSSVPLLAACNRQSIRVYPVHSKEPVTQPAAILEAEQPSGPKHRKRCAKFLADQTLAVAAQFLEGRADAPIQIYQVTPDGSMRTPLKAGMSVHGTSGGVSRRRCANIIAPLDDTSSLAGRAGEVFLTGWNDGIARLHDLRVLTKTVATFTDDCDDGQLLSMLPVGHERFLVGSHQNACLKVFDLRMPGGRAYSYLNAARRTSNRSVTAASNHGSAFDRMSSTFAKSAPRQINIFLAVHVHHPHQGRQLPPRRREGNMPSYRGSIYSLSSPSPSSPTIYAGIENDVIQLDFVSTDDVMSARSNDFEFNLGIKHEKWDKILNLSCYERPRAGHESSDPILLRKQLNWGGKGWDSIGWSEDGWDERWRLATYDRQNNNGTRWRSGPSNQY